MVVVLGVVLVEVTEVLEEEERTKEDTEKQK